MSKKAKTRWKRVFGLPRSRWAGRDPALRPLPPDCETVVTPPVLREAGVTNEARGLRALLDDPRFHYRYVILPDGRKVLATHPTSLHWIVGVRHDEAHDRSLANLMVGDQAPIETIVTKPQGSGAPFVPEIWPVPVARRAPRPSAPLLEACRRPDPSRLERQADRAVAVARNDRELDSALLEELRGDVLRLLTTTALLLGPSAIAAELRLQPSRENRHALARVLNVLWTEDAVIREPAEAGADRFVYGIAPLPGDVDTGGQVSGCGPGRPLVGRASIPPDRSL